MIVNVLGFPATQVPTGLNKRGLPIGFQVYGIHLCVYRLSDCLKK